MDKGIIQNVRKSAKTLISAIWLCAEDPEEAEEVQQRDHPLTLALELLGEFDSDFAAECGEVHKPILFQPCFPKVRSHIKRSRKKKTVSTSTETIYDALEKHHMIQFLDTHGCPSCGQMFCELKDKVILSHPSKWLFACMECPCEGWIGYKQLPELHLTREEESLLNKMVREGSDWRLYMEQMSIERLQMEVEFKGEEDDEEES